MSTEIIVTYFATLLGVGVLAASWLKKYRLPESFLLLLLGLVFGPTLLGLVDVGAMGTVPDFLRTLALIIIVFSGAFNMRMRVFKDVSADALKLAIIAVVLTTVLLAVFAHYILALAILPSFLLGAIVSGTSPEVVVAFKDMLPKKQSLLDTLLVESILNSPLSVLIPLIIFDIMAQQHLGASSVSLSVLYLGKFWLMLVAGVGTGVVMGALSSKLFRSAETEFSPLMAFAIALLTYMLSINVGGSGILAVAVCGIIAGNYVFPGRRAVQKFEDAFSVLLRISVFMLLGASINLLPDGGLGISSAKILLFLLIGIFIIRPLAVLITFVKQGQMPTDDFALLGLVGPRGIAAAAIAPLVIANKIPGAELIVVVVFLFVLASIIASTGVAKLLSLGYLSAPVSKKKR